MKSTHTRLVHILYTLIQYEHLVYYGLWVFAYASTHPGTGWRCHGCHRMVQAAVSLLGPLGCRNMGAPELVQLWVSRPRPEPASSPAGQYLQIVHGTKQCKHLIKCSHYKIVHADLLKPFH